MKKQAEPPLDHGDEWRAARKKYYENYRGRWIEIDNTFDMFGHTLFMRDADGKQGPCVMFRDKDGVITWTWALGVPWAYWSF